MTQRIYYILSLIMASIVVALVTWQLYSAGSCLLRGGSPVQGLVGVVCLEEKE